MITRISALTFETEEPEDQRDDRQWGKLLPTVLALPLIHDPDTAQFSRSRYLRK